MPKVNVVSGEYSICTMFKNEGWDIVDNAAEADLLQFPGGADVTPALYYHTRHPTTGNDEGRDKRWQMIFNLALAAGKPMAGICGGGQFLNVMCGGTMIQDINHHAVHSGHIARDERTGEMIWVTSTHHQMMQPHKTDAEVVLTARESSWGEKHVNNTIIGFNTHKMRDIEALWYPKQKCFCFQPHPEYTKVDHALHRLYFSYLDEFFALGSNKVIEQPVVVTGKPIVRIVPQL